LYVVRRPSVIGNQGFIERRIHGRTGSDPWCEESKTDITSSSGNWRNIMIF
jgi:hypothetical protein